MSSQFIFQIVTLVLGIWFTYIGVRTLFSKKYYVNEVEHREGEKVEEEYKSIPSWQRIYTRYGLAGKWLAFGIALLVLFVYSVK